MKCTNKEQEDIIVGEVVRILKSQLETPTYDEVELSDRFSNGYELTLYRKLEDGSQFSRLILLNVTIKETSEGNNLSVFRYGSLDILISEEKMLEIKYYMSLLKTKFIDLVIDKLKAI